MDDIDKDILNRIQTSFPVTPRPYLELGEQVGISEQEAYDRVMKLYSTKIIRRMGASFDSRRLGFTSTLCAMKVPEEKITETVRIINKHVGVTHNYKRNHDYNVWFTVISPNRDKLLSILGQIERESGISPIREMPAKQFFKIKVDFQFKKDEEEGAEKKVEVGNES
jgi:DNA-binding Lrp family transcriptional regulator